MRITAIRQGYQKQFTGVLVPVAVFLLVCGCARKAEQGSSGSQISSTLAVVDSATTARITGEVHLDGPAPPASQVNMQSEEACAKARANGAPGQSVAVGSDGALADVVVYLSDGQGNGQGDGLAHYRFDTPQSAVLLDQKGCMYDPRVVALMINQTLEIHNSDGTIHNVHAMPRTNSEWNKAQPAGGAVLRTSFPKPELAIPFMCNVHPWMRAFVFVFDHPYFAVTSADGKFALKNVPPGTYKLSAWQEKLGTQTQNVTVQPQGHADVSFRFNSGAASK